MASEAGLMGYWPIDGDCRDHSGRGHHGRNHGVDLAGAIFDGRGGHVEVPAAGGLSLGAGDFTAAAWVWTAEDIDDVIGDVLSRYDPARRRGLNLSIRASAGGYNSQGDDRHVYFGVDDGRLGQWEDCGRPSPTSNYISNSLTVFDGGLYAGITDAPDPADWAHVFRYLGGDRWEDCGRVTDLAIRGVGPMIVHRGGLYAATWSCDWTRVIPSPEFPVPYHADLCRVHRYAGGKEWIDCGQPGRNKRLYALASFKGSLYVIGEDAGVYRYEGGTKWELVRMFDRYGHPMAVHNGRLFIGVHNPAVVLAYDGQSWQELPNPSPTPPEGTQLHAFDVYRGRLHVATWPGGTVERLNEAGRWDSLGRLGESTEGNGLVVYNGKLYCGTIPYAEVYRYEEGQNWTRLRRFHEPAGGRFESSRDWARLTCLTVYDGKLFAGVGSCTSSHLDAPCDARGQVFAVQAGRCVSYDRDLGSGWRHLAAVRRRGRLELYVNGKLEVASKAGEKADCDLDCDQPLRIGAGEMDSFSGRIREVRLYGLALDPAELAGLARRESLAAPLP